MKNDDDDYDDDDNNDEYTYVAQNKYPDWYCGQPKWHKRSVYHFTNHCCLLVCYKASVLISLVCCWCAGGWREQHGPRVSAACQYHCSFKSVRLAVFQWWCRRRECLPTVCHITHSAAAPFAAGFIFYLTNFYGMSRIARCNSQSMSVCESCPSRSGVLYRRMKIRSCSLQHQVGQSF